jgi:hypothetical protein
VVGTSSSIIMNVRPEVRRAFDTVMSRSNCSIRLKDPAGYRALWTFTLRSELLTSLSLAVPEGAIFEHEERLRCVRIGTPGRYEHPSPEPRRWSASLGSTSTDARGIHPIARSKLSKMRPLCEGIIDLVARRGGVDAVEIPKQESRWSIARMSRSEFEDVLTVPAQRRVRANGSMLLATDEHRAGGELHAVAADRSEQQPGKLLRCVPTTSISAGQGPTR